MAGTILDNGALVTLGLVAALGNLRGPGARDGDPVQNEVLEVVCGAGRERGGAACSGYSGRVWVCAGARSVYVCVCERETVPPELPATNLNHSVRLGGNMDAPENSREVDNRK